MLVLSSLTLLYGNKKKKKEIIYKLVRDQKRFIDKNKLKRDRPREVL